MTTIEYSLIPDADVDYRTTERLIAEFTRETGVTVKLRRMEWNTAWNDLIAIATQGQGADISHVGSTWVSSLMTMNAISPIHRNLIAKVGGEQTFVHPAWASTTAEEDRQTYGIPLSTYMYIVAYRKDLLEKTNIHASAAFATPLTFEQTVQKLEALQVTENAWLMPFTNHPYTDLVHMLASWVWSSGGHLMDNRGKQVVFNSPAALAGIKAFLTLLRRMPNANYLGADQCLEALIQGRAAAVVTDPHSFLNALQTQPQAIMDNIRAASLMSIPWSGGSSVVIWRSTQGYPAKLEACHKLIEFLARRSTMLEFAQEASILPARTDALDEVFHDEHPLRPVMLQLISTGRSYRPISLWRRIEFQLGVELGTLAKELLQKPETDLDTLVTKTINHLAERLNLTLG